MRLSPHFQTSTAVASLVISLWALSYTWRTYALTHRPYVGVVQEEYKLSGDPPTKMVWRFVLKNTGSLPAWVTLAEHETTVTTEGRLKFLPREPFTGGRLLMPGQSADLGSQLTASPEYGTVRDILSGRTTLEVHLRLTYESRGQLFWNSKYRYFMRSYFKATNIVSPSFVMISADAD